MKHLLPLLLFMACKPDKPHVCPPTTKVITKYNTVIMPVIDTLVIIQTYDSIPDPGPNVLVRAGSWEESPHGQLFQDGRRIDTIYKHTIIYY